MYVPGAPVQGGKLVVGVVLGWLSVVVVLEELLLGCCVLDVGCVLLLLGGDDGGVGLSVTTVLYPSMYPEHDGMLLALATNPNS